MFDGELCYDCSDFVKSVQTFATLLDDVDDVYDDLMLLCLMANFVKSVQDLSRVFRLLFLVG